MNTTRSMRGYTLLELVVSVGIFAIVMMTATSAYLTLIRLDKHARSVNDVANNLSFAVDSMSRSIRTGTAYKCNNSAGTPNCWPSNPGSSFGFNDSEVPARSVVYSVANNKLVASINGGAAIPLTDPRIYIKTLSFYVRGVGTGDSTQPQTIFSIQGEMATGVSASTTFSIQGSATQRLLEL